ncbi:hypothetical protein [Immundisolibacter sp.]|uniref:hypothetical protein n=1 Tax=Immundisolibacter sp. TaxID=1934948 RepID=UPI002620874E|nr:hypothetical protein [Immundisolibacter sp.]MDD3650038.1 hypothetical protein [Immundisolibacter sp.]
MFRSMLFAVAALLAAPAFADLTAVYALAGGEQLRVEYRDAANFRIGTDAENYQLMVNGHLYAVAQGQVIDVQKVSRQIRAVGADTFLAGLLGDATSDVPTDVSVRPLGRRETIAGYTGEVYEAVARTSNGEQRAEVVVADDADLKAVQDALMKVAKDAVAAVGAESSAYARPLQQVEQLRLGGVLRYGEDLRLVSLQRAPIAAGRIALP